MPTLPSPSGGLNPWPNILQQPQQPAGNSIVQSLLDAKNARLERESEERVAAFGQLGQLVPALGGAGTSSILEQLMRHSGAAPENFNIAESFFARNDPATIRGREAESSLRLGQAASQFINAGIGANYNDDGTINYLGVPTDESLNAVIRMGASRAPRTTNMTTYEGQNTSTRGQEQTVEQIVQLEDGTWAKVTRVISDENQRRAGSEGSDPSAANAPDVSAASSQMTYEDASRNASDEQLGRMFIRLIKEKFGEHAMYGEQQKVMIEHEELDAIPIYDERTNKIITYLPLRDLNNMQIPR